MVYGGPANLHIQCIKVIQPGGVKDVDYCFRLLPEKKLCFASCLTWKKVDLMTALI